MDGFARFVITGVVFVVLALFAYIAAIEFFGFDVDGRGRLIPGVAAMVIAAVVYDRLGAESP